MRLTHFRLTPVRMCSVRGVGFVACNWISGLLRRDYGMGSPTHFRESTLSNSFKARAILLRPDVIKQSRGLWHPTD